ncbi:50S ribosomal protein L6 [bacterium]|nr:50S ribosomal protein L6 [bacterium]|tara:strand:- start:1967 stop:2494 length:528 start_codon:yes stop_codon:yes gene_type:complete
MSRIGRKAILLPMGVEVTDSSSFVEVKGPKGVLKVNTFKNVSFKKEGNKIIVESKAQKKFHGTFRSLLENAVIGVSKGFSYSLIADGPGYRVSVSGKKLTIKAGYSHDVILEIPEFVDVEVVKGEVKISGICKQDVGGFCDKVMQVRPVEPYKLQGIKRKDLTYNKKKRRVVEAA